MVPNIWFHPVIFSNRKPQSRFKLAEAVVAYFTPNLLSANWKDDKKKTASCIYEGGCISAPLSSYVSVFFSFLGNDRQHTQKWIHYKCTKASSFIEYISIVRRQFSFFLLSSFHFLLCLSIKKRGISQSSVWKALFVGSGGLWNCF